MRFGDNLEIESTELAEDDIFPLTTVADNKDKKITFSSLADWILNKFAGLSLGGSNRSVKAAIDTLTTNMGDISNAETFNITLNSSVSGITVQNSNCVYIPSVRMVIMSVALSSASGSIPANNNVIATIPEEYRPSTLKQFGAFVYSTASSPTFEMLSVYTNGNISLRAFVYGNRPITILIFTAIYTI